MKLRNSSIQLSATDLVNYLECEHLTYLDKMVIDGKLAKPDWQDPRVAIIQQKGLEHEKAYIESLREMGYQVHDLTDNFSNAATVEAMKKGYDIITQAPLRSGQWFGIADILRRVEGKSVFGDYSYEVEDTKLAQETKSGTILQLFLNTEILAELQEVTPKRMHVVKPGEGFPTDHFFYNDFQAYFHFIKSRFESYAENIPEESYPLPVSRCSICRWWKQCDKQWHDDDHLSLIAGIRSTQLNELERQKVSTLKGYAEQDKPLKEKPEKGNPSTYERIHNQAKIQLDGRIKKEPVYELLPFEQGRGLNRLPSPNKELMV